MNPTYRQMELRFTVALALRQAQRYLLGTAGGVLEQHDLSIRWPVGLRPHPGLAGRVAIRFLEHLHPRFIAVNQRAFQRPFTHQFQQWEEVFAALDHPAGLDLPGDFDAMPGQYAFKTVQR